MKAWIIGPQASGKTTFSHWLAATADVPVFHLDAMFWDARWRPLPGAERRRELYRVLSAHDDWVIDGTYTSVQDDILTRAGSVFVMGTSLPVAMRRLVTRRTSVDSCDVPPGGARARGVPRRLVLSQVRQSLRKIPELRREVIRRGIPLVTVRFQPGDAVIGHEGRGLGCE